MIKKKTALVLMVTLALLSSMMTFSITGMVYGNAISQEEREILNETKKLMSLKTYIEENYVEDTSNIDLMTGAMKGMFQALGDPYSQYLTEEELTTMQETVSGSFSGIGIILVEKENGEIVVVSPIENTPAEKAGIKTGDIIVKVDDTDTMGMHADEVVKRIKGPEKTKVTIFIKRETMQELLKFELKREVINVESVDGEILDNEIVYIRIRQFDEDSYNEFEKVVNTLNVKEQKGIVLDLRQNPGGYVTQSVKIADAFIEDQLIVYTEDGKGNREDFQGDKDAINLPLVVLVDGGSASSSEILAGALKDNEIGTLVGMQTFGKGLVQNIKPLSDGTGVKLTIQKYYTPKGITIDKIGITPDVIVEGNKNDQTDLQLAKAIEVLMEKISK